jgi:hypothetical protein
LQQTISFIKTENNFGYKNSLPAKGAKAKLSAGKKKEFAGGNGSSGAVINLGSGSDEHDKDFEVF